MKWEIKPISELCFLAIDCVNKTAPLSENITPYKMLRTTNVKSGFIDFEAVRYVEEEVFKKWTRRAQPQYGDVVFTREAPAGEVGRFTARSGDYFLGQRLFLYRPNPALLDWNYLAYVLQSPQIQGYVNGIAYGATVPHMAVSDMEHLKIPVPPISVQKRIGEILSHYDDLIENNLKRIKLLEEMAEITYEEWFVRLHFPGHESSHIIPETGLPKGWKEVGLSEIITKLESGSRPKGGIDKSLEEGIPSVGAENVIGLGRYNYSSEKLVSEEFFSKMKRGRICQKDILIYKDGAYIGKTSMFQDAFPHQTCAVNEHVFLVNSDKEFWQNYLFFTLSREDYYLKMQGLNSNAAQPGLNQEKIRCLSLIRPLDKNISDFNVTVDPLIRSIFAFAKQNRLLQEARDILLPRLMTGVIDVESYDPAQLFKEAA